MGLTRANKEDDKRDDDNDGILDVQQASSMHGAVWAICLIRDYDLVTLSSRIMKSLFSSEAMITLEGAPRSPPPTQIFSPYDENQILAL